MIIEHYWTHQRWTIFTETVCDKLLAVVSALIFYLSAADGSFQPSSSSQVRQPPGDPPARPAWVHRGGAPVLPPACSSPPLNPHHCPLNESPSSEPFFGRFVVQIRWWAEEPQWCQQIWDGNNKKRMRNSWWEPLGILEWTGKTCMFFW